MDRFGLFIDAGYLLAAGGQLCVGEKQRNKLACDYAGLHKKIVELCSARVRLPLFRSYWYDGAHGHPHPQPTTDQLRISSLPTIKLRLGRIIRGQQKGVDSMLTRDMMTLARERAMPVACLLAGDEDLREAVVAAQDIGVQVVLLGITPVPGLTNQSFTLINECDDHFLLDKSLLAPYFALRAVEMSVEPTLELEPVIESEKSADEVARGIGEAFCDDWFEANGIDTAMLIIANQPVVPKDVDAPLLRKAESAFGSLRGREELRKTVRNAFLTRLRELVG